MKIPANWHWRDEAIDGGTAAVFDIDGVLANADERQHFITGGRRDWKGFFGACGEDEVIEETRRLLELLVSSAVVILLTGRPTEVRETTVKWLKANGIRWDLLIMRERGDYNASLTFKQQSVRRLKAMGFDLKLAFEDDADNQEMFRSEGVPCMYMDSGYYEDRDAERKKDA